MYFCFVNGVFSRHGASGPESNATFYFNEARQVTAPVGHQTTSVWSSLSGAESAIYYCLVIGCYQSKLEVN